MEIVLGIHHGNSILHLKLEAGAADGLAIYGEQGDQGEGRHPLVQCFHLGVCLVVIQPVSVFRDAVSTDGSLPEERGVHLGGGTALTRQLVDDAVQTVFQ